jgi:uncharacterized membrane protein YkgB
MSSVRLLNPIFNPGGSTVKRTLVTIMLLGLLVLTSYEVNAITPTALPVPAAQELYMPRNVQMAYEERTRSPDGNPGEKYWQNKAGTQHEYHCCAAKPHGVGN